MHNTPHLFYSSKLQSRLHSQHEAFPTLPCRTNNLFAFFFNPAGRGGRAPHRGFREESLHPTLPSPARAGAASYPAGEARRVDPTHHRLLTEGNTVRGPSLPVGGASLSAVPAPPPQQPAASHLATQFAAQALPVASWDPRGAERGPVQGHEGRQILLTVPRHGRTPPLPGRELRGRGGAGGGASPRREAVAAVSGRR